MTEPIVTSLPDDLALWRPRFATADLIEQAAALLPHLREPAGPAAIETEGPRWEIIIAPGAVQIRTSDYARASRTQERSVKYRTHDVDHTAAWLTDLGHFPHDREPTREITGWSPKSRNNMIRTLCQLDYSPLFTDPTRLPAMLTLTYPADWLTVAPCGKAVKEHMKALRKRYQRAWSADLLCVWKLEFQRRGAPHVHMLIVPPHGLSRDRLRFRDWISLNWAQIVAHPDALEYAKHLAAGTGIDWAQGLRSTDPRRVAVYFTKHGALAGKEYQHCVPEPWQKPGKGPGRFWGYWGLSTACAGARVTPAMGITAGRILRRWARAQGTTREIAVLRVEQATGRVRLRKSRVRVRRLPDNHGWVSVNDGAAFGSQLARALGISEAPDGPPVPA